MMSEKYPFNMDWSQYTDEELIKEAQSSLSGLDRGDLVALVAEFALRMWQDINGLSITREKFIEKFETS